MAVGVLYIVSTPIGNMDDITLRALEVLEKVDYVISEDTRETAKVLKKYNLEKSQLSYRDQNHDRILERVLGELQAGAALALVTDSGTPLISDPGYKLVRDVIENNIPVTVIPGPSAVIAALTVSGLPTDKFAFLGFLPKSAGQRRKVLTAYGACDCTLVLYESPFRVTKLLEQILDVLGDRQIVLARELTKVHEEILRGTCSELLAQYKDKKWKGEFVVLVGKEDL